MYTQQIKTFVENRPFPDFVRSAQREDKLHLRSKVLVPLEATFWAPKPKNTDISDQEKFRDFKADISTFTRI